MMAIKEAIRLEGDTRMGFDTSVRDGIGHSSVEKLSYGDMTVLFRYAYSNGTGKMVCGIVLGFKASEPYKTSSGASAIKIETIPKDQREAVARAIGDRIQGPVNFW